MSQALRLVSTSAEPVRVGESLPNGATVLAVHYDREQEMLGDLRPQGVVLAWNGHEYVTWWFIENERGVSTSTGRYTFNFWHAARDFVRRAGQVGEASE